MNRIFADIGTSVFETMSRMARVHQAINLGQGFPDDPGPDDVRARAAEAILSGWNQYPPMMGLPELREAVAQHYRRFLGLDFDPADEIMITSGATEALAGALLALIEPGDEVILFQPMYDAYLPLVQRAGGIARFVTLRPPGWTFSEADLEAVVTPRTRVVLFNNPLNPAGVAYDSEALAPLSRVCVRHDLIAICDEVWEHLIFDERLHTPLIAADGMRERCVKIRHDSARSRDPVQCRHQVGECTPLGRGKPPRRPSAERPRLHLKLNAMFGACQVVENARTPHG